MPTATPVTTPVTGSTVARELLVLLQVPPLTLSDKVIWCAGPTHTLSLPVIVPAPGTSTVIAIVAEQPPALYDMVDVPAATPVTTPPADTVATVGVPELHVPPAVASVNAVVDPAQIVVGLPLIVPIAGLTVIGTPTTQPPNE